MNIQEQIIYKGIQILEEKTGLKGRFFASLKDKEIDGKLEIKSENKKNTFALIVKKEIKSTHLVTLLQLKERLVDLVIIGEVIYPGIRERLRKLGLNYIDIAGNCHIKWQSWIVMTEGFKTETHPNVTKDRAFTKTALPLVFHFLNEESYINATYRQMAEDYNIALGNINNIINSLIDLGFLIRMGKKELKLIKKKQLLDEWIINYDQRLKPLLLIGHFRFLNQIGKEWETIPLKNTETQWGGEPAANLLTGYLKPAFLTLYTQESQKQLIQKYRLVPDENGVLSIYRKFWNFNAPSDTVPSILVYADLINSVDARNIDTAKRIFNESLENKL